MMHLADCLFFVRYLNYGGYIDFNTIFRHSDARRKGEYVHTS